MHPLLKSWRVRLLIISVLIAALLIVFRGVQFGIDFKGGSVLIFQFDRPLTPQEMQQAVLIIEKRLNWTGLSSVRVRGWGDQQVVIELSTDNPQEIQRIKESVLRQGKFEAVVDQKVVLTGKDIAAVKPPIITPAEIGYTWKLPFVLTPEGVKRFYTGVHGKCTPDGRCAYVFMYIDRPVGKVLLIPKDIAQEENVLTTIPELKAVEQAPADQRIPMVEFLKNAGLKKWFIVDRNFNPQVLLELNAPVILAPEENYLVPFLQEHNIPYTLVPKQPGESWIWAATNLRSVVHLTPDVTNVTPEHASNELVITGWAKNYEDAKQKTETLRIILESGALPAGLQLVSERRIPAKYGEQAFYTFLITIFLAMIAVSIYVATRYKDLRIAVPISITVFSEIVMIFGFAALIGWRIDIPSMIGIIASTGTGVDDQIVITDEVLHGGAKREEKERETGEKKSIWKKIRRAFFIVWATASALIMAMLPVLFSGIPTLVGFALTTIVGVLVGVLITRPAFGEIIRYVVSRK